MASRHCKARLGPEERVVGTAANPTFSMCCCKGEGSLPKLPRCPPQQEEYWLGDTAAATEFRWNARDYNSVLSFTSQRAKLELPFQDGVQVLRPPPHTWDALVSWAKDTKILKPSNFTRSFLRYASSPETGQASLITQHEGPIRSISFQDDHGHT